MQIFVSLFLLLAGEDYSSENIVKILINGLGYVGLVFILVSIYKLFRFNVSTILVTRIWGITISLFTVITTLYYSIFYESSIEIGTLLTILSWSVICGTGLLLHFSRKWRINQIKNIINEYVNDANSRNKTISLQKIATKFKISLKVKSITQYLNKILSEQTSIVPIANLDYKKRLYGMIRLEKEINVTDAAKFLGVPKKQIKELLYDLAGENAIEGRFKDDLFIITSDIDDFINDLEESFKKWEKPSKKQF